MAFFNADINVQPFQYGGRDLITTMIFVLGVLSLFRLVLAFFQPSEDVMEDVMEDVVPEVSGRMMDLANSVMTAIREVGERYEELD